MRLEDAERILLDFDWKFTDAKEGRWIYRKNGAVAIINLSQQDFQSREVGYQSIFVDGVIVDKEKKKIVINSQYCDEEMVLEAVEGYDISLRE